MPVDLRKAIANANDIETEVVDVPQWGVKVGVRGMSAGERADFLTSFTDPETGTIDYKGMYPNLLISTVVDPETGDNVFTRDDFDLINSKSGAAVELVGKVAQRLSGMSADAEEEVGKDSSTTPS